MDREDLFVAVALLVAVGWLIVALASLLLRDYTALTIVTPVMLVVTGFLFGRKNDAER